MAESEVKLMIDTGEYNAICEAHNLPPGSSASTVAVAAKTMRAWKDNIMRSRFGLLALLFVDADDIDAGIDWLIKKGQKKKK